MTLEGFPRIAVDPAVCGGRPTIAGTRVRVSDVLETLAAGASPEQILADFPYLSIEDVRGALVFAARAADHPIVLALNEVRRRRATAAGSRRGGHEADHVMTLGLLAAADRQIAHHVETSGAILMTKDEDFLVLRLPDRFGLLCCDVVMRRTRRWWPGLKIDGRGSRTCFQAVSGSSNCADDDAMPASRYGIGACGARHAVTSSIAQSDGKGPMIRSLILAAALLAAPALAAPPVKVPPSLQGATVGETVARMKPGEYLWAPQVAPDGPVVIVVSIAQQRAYAYRNGLPIGISTVSTGKKGHETPTGVFTLLQKNVDHKSNLYDDAPMPYMQRLTWDGIALHAGNLPGYPASHGCVRLPLGFAKLLYEVTKLGLTVIVTGGAEVPRFAPTPSILSNDPAKGKEELFGGTLWQPERQRTGPVSMIISSADGRMLVLRNGVPIGSAPVKIAGEVTGTTAYTLGAIENGIYKWIKLPMPGETLAGPVEVTPDERARLTVPEEMIRATASVVTPGTTVVVTPDTLRSGGAGKKMTVMTAGK
ncbi:hypothetical protein COO09_08630 [Rhizorhabdus dicambivorans]|uniref:L,D-TPase catalytic domain-containing protein n=2 Tax=Rhizorhabdus dicambivorans TaxID=1850238 RepID=A0A2A4FYR8_9SPHN|nr:hypothetical protein CMV14_04495 [Rhizorhabdus dicambivorans]PCE42875.1 hypothetical protein COO09_08630 [Rhizorhabdus dicambivorans]